MVVTNELLTGIRTDIKDYIESVFLYCNIGEDSTTASATDTELGSEILRVATLSVNKSVANAITVSAEIPATQGNSSIIREAGFNSSNSTTIDACDTIAGWTDSADMTVHLNNTTFFEGTGAIDLTKDGGASATASTYKTVTSTDFTSQTLGFILYIKDSTALSKLATSSCLTVRYGSDSSNYYEWVYDASDLDTGKVLINGLTSANADSTTGTPSLTAMDYFYIALTADAAATTWSDGDFIMDYIVKYNGTQYSRNTVTAIGKADSIVLYLDETLTITVTQS